MDLVYRRIFPTQYVHYTKEESDFKVSVSKGNSKISPSIKCIVSRLIPSGRMSTIVKWVIFESKETNLCPEPISTCLMGLQLKISSNAQAS